jgi:hypothetical protein
MEVARRYAAVFGRAPFVEEQSAGALRVQVFGFPPLRRSFWRSLISEAHDTTVYITAGMSDYPMQVPPQARGDYSARIELMAVCDGQITGGPSGTDDVVSALLLAVAEYVLDNGIYIDVGHTLDFQERLAPNTEMTAFLFTPAEGIDEKRVRRCSRAEAILNVMPITRSELEFTRNEGMEALIDRFQASGVGPVFDYMRKSSV